MSTNLPARADAGFAWTADPPDPLGRPEYYSGLLWRRPLAFAIDLALLSMLMAILWLFNLITFGLFALLIGLLWPALLVIYAAVLIGGSEGATFGMRRMGLQVRSWNGQPPSALQAAVMAIVFLVTMPATSGLVLLVPLFSSRRRCLHDFLSGVVVVNAAAVRDRTD